MALDLSKISDSDLLALKSGKLANVSTDGLMKLKSSAPLQIIDEAPQVTGSFGQNLAAGIGKGLTDIARGAGQILGINSQEEIDEAKRLDSELMKTAGGNIGNVLGAAIPLVATAPIPGANTYTGAAVSSSLLGALQPTASDESRAANAGFAAVGGMAGKFAGDKIGNAVAKAVSGAKTKAITDQALNVPRDAALAAAQKAGAVVPPRMVREQPIGGAVLEAFGGRTKLEQQASNINQPVWNNMARKALGIPDDTPITPEILSGIRAKAGEAYEALRSAGTINADKQFGRDLAKITQKFSGAAKDFPDLAKNEIGEIVASVNKPAFSADSAIDAIAILRDRAASAYAKGDKGLGSAYKQTGQALEDAIERNLLETGDKSLVKGFQAARKLIAKTYSVEGALDGGGNIAAQKLGAQLAKGKPLSDELKVIGEFARNFPKAAQNAAKVEPYSVTDAFAGGMLGTVGGLPAAAIPLARPAARAAVLSAPYQSAMAAPKYGVSKTLSAADLIANNPRLRAMLPGFAAALTTANAE